jgi:hypothetical protein
LVKIAAKNADKGRFRPASRPSGEHKPHLRTTFGNSCRFPVCGIEGQTGSPGHRIIFVQPWRAQDRFGKSRGRRAPRGGTHSSSLLKGSVPARRVQKLCPAGSTCPTVPGSVKRRPGHEKAYEFPIVFVSRPMTQGVTSPPRGDTGTPSLAQSRMPAGRSSGLVRPGPDRLSQRRAACPRACVAMPPAMGRASIACCARVPSHPA